MEKKKIYLIIISILAIHIILLSSLHGITLRENLIVYVKIIENIFDKIIDIFNSIL